MQHFIDTLSFNLLLISLPDTDETKLSFPRILRINSHAAAFLGYPEKALIDQPLERLFATKDEIRLWRTAVAKIASNCSANCFEGEVITQNQHRVRVSFSISPLFNQQSKSTDIILLLQPIKLEDNLFIMHQAFEQSASAVMITDRSGRIEYVNLKLTELTGYPATELIGENPKRLQSGNMSAEHYLGMWESLLKTGEWRGEIQNQKKNGEIYWVYESISAIKNSADEITHFVAVEEDISRRKEIETALTESEERFRQMAELTGEWLWEQDPKGYYLYSSIAVQQILGYSPEKVVGRHYTEYLTLQDKENQQSFATNQHPFYALINHYQHRDGHQILTESTGLPIINSQGELIKWRGVDRDITARMHFQDALIESEKRTRLIIESSINAIVIMDAYGIITDWNHRAEKMLGWTHDEAVGQRLDDLIIPARFRNAHRQGLHTFLHTGFGPFMNKQTEQVALRRNGTEFPIELSVSPLKLGNSYIFSGFIHDISGRKAAEQQIRQVQINLAIAQNEINIAQQIQATLSPTAPLKSDQFEVTGFCLPADKVGGDYFDYFFRNETLLDIVIADVSGHSIGPALFMVETRSVIRAHNHHIATPADTLGMLNNFLFEDLDNSDYFITLFYLQVNLPLQFIKYANAGHPPPLTFNTLLQEFTELDADGLILGIRNDILFEEKTHKLRKGDLILFYTDGIIEAENLHKEFFGVARLKEILMQNAQESPQTIIDSLFAELKTFCQRTTFNDDITLMIFKWQEH